MMVRTLLFAGTREQAASYAHEHGLDGNRWRFLFDLRDLVGCSSGSRRPRVILIGTVRERPDYRDLVQALEARNAHLIDETTR